MKFKIGDRVIIKSKYGLKKNLKLSPVYRKMKELKQPYAYITDVRQINKIYVLDAEFNDIKSGDYYEEKDVKSYLILERKQKLQKIYQS